MSFIHILAFMNKCLKIKLERKHTYEFNNENQSIIEILFKQVFKGKTVLDVGGAGTGILSI